MKKMILLVPVLVCVYFTEAQFLKKLKEKVDNKVNKTVDDATSGKKNDSGNNDNLTDNTETNEKSQADPGSIKVYSKYDFVPGEKIIVFEDFMQDAVGDFPGKWTTNASGEIVTTNEYPGRWLNISKEGSYVPQFIKGLSDNFTLESDLIFIPPANPTGPNTPATALQVINAPGGKPNFDYSIDRSYFQLDPYMGNINIAGYTASGEKILSNEFSVKGIQRKTPFRFHVSVWRQKSRLRVYLDQTKAVDAPSLLSPDIKYNGIRLATTMSNDGSIWLIGNFKFASGLPDTRNKLLTEGKFSTTGILFDVSSAVIRPNSYGTLKDIAALLKDNPGLNIKIIGHTDNEGDPKANLDLSRRRAEAVKAVLASEFSIEEGRLQADGKGADQQAAPNTTPEGRAQNRRVEFVKL